MLLRIIMGRKLSTGHGPDTEHPETLSQKGAMALAKRLEHFWHGQGYTAARFWAEPIGERFEKVGSYDIYRVVSNLVNGLPPKYREDTASARH